QLEHTLVVQVVSSEHMRRVVVISLALALSVACADDRVTLQRGPLGPAGYSVEVSATRSSEPSQHRAASLRVQPTAAGVTFVLETTADEEIQADLEQLEDGSLKLQRVRGASVGTAGETEIASLVGQLDPPLPNRPVRLGEGWSATRRITTETLSASLRTELRVVRYRRLAGTDAAELEGKIDGRLQTAGERGVLRGTLGGSTRIAWSVRSGRVVAAETRLVWLLAGGDEVVLETRVDPD
ncbi:MAG: hypothetical protein ACREQY_14080, partial [Candidatus Binatia bacterium]